MNDSSKSKQDLINELAELRTLNDSLKNELTLHARAKEATHVFRKFVESSNEAIAISDPSGRLVYANQAHQNLFGIDPGKTLDRFIDEYVSTGSCPAPIYGDSTFSELEPFLQHFSFSFQMGETELMATILHDVTELKQAEEAYRMLVDHSLQGYIILQNTGIIFANDTIAEIFGYSANELKNLPIKKLLGMVIHADDHSWVSSFIDDFFSGKPLSPRQEFRCITKHGTTKWIETYIGLVNFQGQPTLHAALIDITDRKRAEELVRYKFLFDKVGDGVIMLDHDCKFIEANDRFLEKAGLSREEILERSFLDFVPKEERPYIELKKNQILREGRGEFELEFIFDDSTIIPFEINCQSVNYLGKHCILCVSRDITEKKLLQDQLILSERLAATGQLAASVAHELNSPLQAITVILGLMDKELGEDKEMKENVALLTAAFKSIRDTVKNLLDLNRPGNEKKRMVNINRVITNTADLVRSHLKTQKINLKLDLAGDIPDIFASSQQMGQVFLNMINNAAEAIGSMYFPHPAHSRSTTIKNLIFISTRIFEGSIVIEIRDNGTGISPDALHHVFEPFYTLKKRMGIGIGLSICHGIIRAHNGIITAANLPQGGALFTITLPVKRVRRFME